MLCVATSDIQKTLAEVHNGEAGPHQGGKRLVQQFLFQGLYWPTIEADAQEYVKKCRPCQIYANAIHVPHKSLKPISLSHLGTRSYWSYHASIL
jgi:hypothetical protein